MLLQAHAAGTLTWRSGHEAISVLQLARILGHEISVALSQMMFKDAAMQAMQGCSEVASQIKAIDRDPLQAELNACAVRCIEADARAADPHDSRAFLALAQSPQDSRVRTIPINGCSKIGALHA